VLVALILGLTRGAQARHDATARLDGDHHILVLALSTMHPLKARVAAGRIVLDEPTSLPDGEHWLVAMNDDDLDDEERAALDASIEEGIQDAEAGRHEDAFEVMNRLRARA